MDYFAHPGRRLRLPTLASYIGWLSCLGWKTKNLIFRTSSWKFKILHTRFKSETPLPIGYHALKFAGSFWIVFEKCQVWRHLIIKSAISFQWGKLFYGLAWNCFSWLYSHWVDVTRNQFSCEAHIKEVSWFINANPVMNIKTHYYQSLWSNP